MFAIASNSKLFVATSIGLLIDNGTQLLDGKVFGYDTKLKDLYEDWSLVDPYMSEHLDVLDLLCKRIASRPQHACVLTFSDAERSTSTRLFIFVSLEIQPEVLY